MIGEADKLQTLTKAKKTGREDGGAEEPQKDGATDELEAGLLSLWTKPLPNTVQGHLQIPEPHTERGREGGRGREREGGREKEREGGREHVIIYACAPMTPGLGMANPGSLSLTDSRGELVVRLEDVSPGSGDEAGEGGLVLGEGGGVGELCGIHLTLLLPILAHQRVDEGSEGASEVLEREGNILYHNNLRDHIIG